MATQLKSNKEPHLKLIKNPTMDTKKSINKKNTFINTLIPGFCYKNHLGEITYPPQIPIV